MDCNKLLVLNIGARFLPSYINAMFKPSYSRYNTRLQKNTRQQVLYFFGMKILIKIIHSTKNVKIRVSFTRALKRDILRKLCR